MSGQPEDYDAHHPDPEQVAYDEGRSTQRRRDAITIRKHCKACREGFPMDCPTCGPVVAEIEGAPDAT